MAISEDKLRIITLSMERCRVVLVRIVVDLSINDTVVKPIGGVVNIPTVLIKVVGPFVALNNPSKKTDTQHH